jgi:hypothetical protein
VKKLTGVLIFFLIVCIMPMASGAKPKCTKQQLVSLNQFAIEYNDNRSYFLKYVVYANEANEGIVRTRITGDKKNEVSFRERSVRAREEVVTEWARLMRTNFDTRRKLFGDGALGKDNIRMIEIARECGSSGKFPGSGGAILGVVDAAGIAATLQANGVSGFPELCALWPPILV